MKRRSLFKGSQKGKLPLPQDCADERFIPDVQALRDLALPNIVGVYHADVPGGRILSSLAIGADGTLYAGRTRTRCTRSR
jgi:hypothetical protein